MRKGIILLCFILGAFNLVLAQNTYKYGHIPFVRNFSANEYHGVAQNWAIIQNDQNFIFVANNSAILFFDGAEWSKLQLSKGQSSRCFVKDDKGTIYVGGDNEYGKIYFSESGKVSYQKLSDSITNYGKFWKAYHIKNQIIFASKTNIVTLQNDTIVSIIKPKKQSHFDKTIQFKDKIICYIDSKADTTKYNAIFDGETFIKIKNSETFLPRGVFSIRNNNYIINKYGEIRKIINKNGMYEFELTGKNLGDYMLKFNPDANPDLDINCITVTKKMIAVGTDGQGILLFDLRGRIIRVINKTDGLINQQVRDLYFDHDNNLWSANDNEIFLIDLSNPICYFDSDDGVTSSIEDIIFDKNNTINLATHIDLFVDKNIKTRKRIETTNAFEMDIFQIKQFTFSDSTKKTLVVANNGVYTYNPNGTTTLISEIYAWDLSQSTSNPNRIWVGLDGDGIGSLIYNPTIKKIKLEIYSYPNTFGEVRKVIEKNNNVYYAVKDGGIAVLDTSKKQENNYLKGLNSTYNYSNFNLCEFNNKIFVGSDNGIYVIKNNQLTPFSKLYNSTHFNNNNLYIHRFYNDENKKLWVVMFKNSGYENEKLELGYIEFDNKDISFTTKPFKTINEGIHVIKKDANGLIWFGGVKKLYVYNPKVNISDSDSMECYISQISLKGDSISSSFIQFNKNLNSEISYNLNTVTFKFTTPSYVGGSKNEYSTFLVGIDDDWSDWTTDNTLKYPRLSDGKYTFKVKAKNFYGQESKIASFEFLILPPWYKTWWAFFLYIISAIFIIYLIIKVSIKRVKDQNEKLEKIVKDRTAVVEKQKYEIEEKNKDIVDSIKYAKRIQNTILPSKERMDEILKDYFVIYKPKDIVSGDFYWADLLDGKSYFSAIDCTGHGVPGAFVSIVGFNGLKRTVNEFKIREPGKILDKLTDIVVDTFTGNESHLKDGMDLSLCSLDYNTLILEYAGANNSLIIIRDGEIIEYKANKQPIGEFDNRQSFINHKIQLQEGDCIFLFSDGYADQFGGPKGKKFKLKTLKNLFVNIAHLPPIKQKEELEKAFNDWKGNIEQLDDVCLIGVKI